MIVSNKIVQRNIKKNSRHIEYNWEKSPDDDSKVRQHFIIVDDKNRKGTLNMILEQLSNINSGLEEIRNEEGNVEGSKLKYLFASYDSLNAPNLIDWSKINKPVKQNKDLYERQRGNLEDYVANRFS